MQSNEILTYNKFMNIGFIPIDNRPVCYTLAQDITAIDSSINFYIPPRELLGDLTKTAKVEEIFSWIKTLPKLDSLIISLDTLAYGGLIPSRRSADSFEEIKNRITELKEILKTKDAKIYAFSSIMRISNNNVNEEEKTYWSEYGKKIFEYSYKTHKNGFCENSEIPEYILNDYLETRKRNFEINKIYLNWQKESFFDTLIFSKDDCAEFGLNVKEAKDLEILGGFTKTGADEIPLTLLARAIQGEIKVAPIFLEPNEKNLISNYEDISIENSVKSQLELANCRITNPNEADILLYVNNFKKNQGEIVMKIPTEHFSGNFEQPKKPYMIADVRFANGADNNFIKEFFKTNFTENFYGYSAWNTSANTLGSLICASKTKFLAKNFNKNAFLKLQATRLLDDWAYQANTRQQLTSANAEELSEIIEPYKNQVEEFLIKKFETSYKFPWNRLFEVEIEFN